MIILCNLLVKLLRFFNLGSGTALPGLIFEKFTPFLIEKLLQKYPNRIVITGTNGKTTTQNMIVAILKKAGRNVISNKSGSNMIRGIISTLIENENNQNKDYLILEVEEGTMPRFVSIIKPKTIIITNIFRDQLDAYGEINKTQDYIKTACQICPNATVICNADDPKLQEISSIIKNKQYHYSLEEKSNDFAYEGCPINIKTNKPIIYKNHTINDYFSTETTFLINGKEEKIKLSVSGIFNISNAMASLLCCVTLEKISLNQVKDALENMKIPFGRGEIFIINNKKIRLFLVKNPAGFDQIIKLFENKKNNIFLIGLNDKIADGRDVSWIWDVNLEKLKNTKKIINTGLRADDMTVRCKYADITEYLECEPDFKVAFSNFIKQKEDDLFIMATYTAMNELRNIIGNYINITPIYE